MGIIARSSGFILKPLSSLVTRLAYSQEPFWKNTALPWPNSASEASPVAVVRAAPVVAESVVYRSQTFLKASR